MRVFFDCEFSGLRQDTTLISIGCVADNGQQFYAELTDYDDSQVDPWVRENVINHLWAKQPEWLMWSRPDYVFYMLGSTAHVAVSLAAWLHPFGAVEMWADCLAYDWVLFCNLYGGAMKIPGSVYYIPFDLATLFKLRGVDPDINREEYSGVKTSAKHNALADSLVIRACYNRIMAK